MTQLTIGKNIDSWCGKCKLMLAHTIETILDGKVKRVHCNTCGAQHAYKANAPGEGPRRTATKRSGSAAEAATVADYDTMLKRYDTNKARPYGTTTAFGTGQLVNHTQFGLGIVTARRGNKIDVLFPDKARTLVHGG